MIDPHRDIEPNNHAALIELGDSHVECIHSQLLFLRHGGYTVHLICSEGIRQQVCNFENLHRFLFLDRAHDSWGHWSRVRSVLRYIRENHIRTIIFNTGGGNNTRDISFFAPRNVRQVGIIHHTHKLKNSFTQFLISRRVQKNFVLNDYLLDVIPRRFRKDFVSAYLIFSEPVETVDIQRDSERLWVAIPGEVDFRRRDYKALIDALESRREHVGTLQFLLLGECRRDGDGKRLRDMINETGLESHFVLFDSFLDRETFFSYLIKSDILLPLIHPGLKFFSHYQRYQVSGAYNLSFGFAKPMLLHEVLKGPHDFDVAAFFYGTGELAQLLCHLAAHPAEFQEKGRGIRECKKFSFEVQCEKYLRHLERGQCYPST